MTITINFAAVLTFLAIYLIVGFFVIMAINIDSLLHVSHVKGEPKIKRGDIKRAFIKSVLFSWAFPYAAIDVAKDKYDSHIEKSVRDSKFEKGGKVFDYNGLILEYFEKKGLYFEDVYHTRFWAIGKGKLLRKFAKQNGYKRVSA